MIPLRRLLTLLQRRDRRRLAVLLVVSVVSALLSVTSIAVFGLLMSRVVESDAITGDIALGLTAFLLIILSNVAKIVTLHGIHRFAAIVRLSLSHRLFRQYLHQPWGFHIDRSSSGLSQGLLSEVDKVVSDVLRPSIDAVSQGMTVVAILLYLLVTSPVVALTASAVLVLAYTLVFTVLRHRLAALGQEHWESNRARFATAAEGFGAVKELKILRAEDSYADLYATAARRHADAEMWMQTFGTVPRQFLEALAFGLIIALVLTLLVLEGPVAQTLPLLAVYAFAGYRLMPSLQIVYRSLAQSRYYAYTVDNLYRDITTLSEELPRDRTEHAAAAERFETLVLKNVFFRYHGSADDVLQGLSISIRRNELIGIIGTTGCGKTTVVDIILGLLEPTQGSLTGIDGLQGRFGYVPQEIFIADRSITGNIALGLPPDQIDHAAVERAARIANLHTFVTDELPAGYDTVVGERGVRLSGGQRQRLGIARALYPDPEILVFDEATNALDTVTEEVVMSAVGALQHRKTIILVAHRLSTVVGCDRIYLLERGRVAASGTYEELLHTSSRFRALAGESTPDRIHA